MGQEISWEIREKAEELYIVDGKTFEAVSEVTGVSVSQLKRWGADGDWTERKREYRTAFADIRRNTVLLRKKLIANAMRSLDPQDVYAAARMEAVAARVQSAESKAPADGNMENRIIKTPADAVDALQDVVEKKINGMLAGGDISLAGIREMKQALELIEKMKTKYTPDRDDKEPATDEDRKRLVEEVDRIMGVK